MSLTPTQKEHFREQLADFCSLAESYEARWAYSQRRPYTGLGASPTTWHTDDCSSYVALAFWWAGHHSGSPAADPLGMHYSGWGYTGSAYAFLKAHNAPKDKYRIGDIAIYGTTWDTVHMTVCRKAGTGTTAIWSSHGQQSGPEPRQPVTYHSHPLLGVYRHPALL
jgi:hypothetical protein